MRKPFEDHLCEYYCDECMGEGSVDCPHCGNDSDCEECKGSGFDKHAIDVQGYLDAVQEFSRRDKKVGGSGAVEHLFEKGRDGNDCVVNYLVGIRTTVGN